MIKRSPLKSDSPGKCTRWHVVIYNKETKCRYWHTVHGTRADARALERKFEDAKRDGRSTTIPTRTFEEVANLFMDDRRAINRRVSTLQEYQTELDIRLLPQPEERLPRLGPRDIRTIRRADMRTHFNALRNSGCTVSQVNESIKTAKAIFAYAFDALAVVHAELILIHPFREGNGRCARLLALLMGLQAGLPTLDFGGIRGVKKKAYIAAVHAALARDYAPMTDVFRSVIVRTLKSVATSSD